jgi:LAGLIDADG DNA endonuclease family
MSYFYQSFSFFTGGRRLLDCNRAYVSSKVTQLICTRNFYLVRVNCDRRIGPHNASIYDLIIGLSLTDAFLEINGNGIRMSFGQSIIHKDFFLMVHQILADNGYCNPIPREMETDVLNNKPRHRHRLNTYSFYSFWFFHKLLYQWDFDSKRFCKVIRPELEQYTTPRMLAWAIMSDGGVHHSGMRLSLCNLTHNDCAFFAGVLYRKFGLVCTVVGREYPILYVTADSMPKLRELVLPYLHPSMHYKVFPSPRIRAYMTYAPA